MRSAHNHLTMSEWTPLRSDPRHHLHDAQSAMSRLTGTYGLIQTLMPLLAHVIALRPTSAQVTLFPSRPPAAPVWPTIGAWSGGAGNISLAGNRNWMALQKAFVASIDAEFPFMREVPFVRLLPAIPASPSGLPALLRRTACAGPRFKSKPRDQPSLKAGKERFCDRHIILPVIGAARSTEALRCAGRVVSSKVRADADRWTISILCEVAEEAGRRHRLKPTTAVVGIDLGLRAFATCSDGRQFVAPRPLRCYAKRLRRRLLRRLSRRQHGSRRRKAARRRVARLHRRIRHIRSAFLHPLSTSIVRDNQTIVIEDSSYSWNAQESSPGPCDQRCRMA